MSRLRPLALSVFLTACASLPALTFVPGEDGGAAHEDGGRDATLPPDDAGYGDDGGQGTADGPVTGEDAGDEAGDDGGGVTIACGAAYVSTCADCPGLPLKCTKAGHSTCIDDCGQCQPGTYPCIHCTSGDAGPHGTCVAVGAGGDFACAAANLCTCDVPTDCPAVTGASETCDTVNGHLRCLTCGSSGTADAGCLLADGGVGVCQIVDGALPLCE